MKSWLFLVLWVLGPVLPVSAHVLQTDGFIGAVMHVDPDDDPIIGQTSTFTFYFRDSSGGLTDQNSKVFFYVLSGEKGLSTQPLVLRNTAGSLLANASFTFPSAGIYVVRVNGQPAGKGGSQPFLLEYTVRVSRTPVPTGWWEEHSGHVLLAVAAGGVLVAVLIFGGRKKRKR